MGGRTGLADAQSDKCRGQEMDRDHGSWREGKRHEFGLNKEVGSEHTKSCRSWEVDWVLF